MFIDKDDLEKVKDPSSFKYQVFEVHSRRYYDGCALIAALTEEEAHKIKEEFKATDPHNNCDSMGWSDTLYETSLVSDMSGIIQNSIHYLG